MNDTSAGSVLVRRPRPSPNRGVAIIVVLGMLALLMVLALAFSVSMRVERAAAGNYASAVYARHMMWSAIARAVQHIDSSMVTNGLEVYPSWDVLASSGAGSEVKLGWGEATNYVPDGLIAALTNTPARWVDVHVAGEQGIRGRCAYLVANCSGFLDAGYAGASNRAFGVTPHEIQVDRLSDVPNAAKFREYQGADARYESLPELRLLQIDVPPPAPVGLSGVRNFMTYSLAPVQKHRMPDGALTNRVYVGGSAAEIAANMVAIKQGFADSGLYKPTPPGTDPWDTLNTAFYNLLDYVDEDSVPTSLASGCTEMVPMINEIKANYFVRVTNGIADVGPFGVYMEWAYPFDLPPTQGPYRVNWEYKVVNNGGNPGLLPSDRAGLVSPLIGAGVCTPNSFAAFFDTAPAKKVPAGAGPYKAKFDVYVRGQVVDVAGQIVDSVPHPYEQAQNRWARIIFDTGDFAEDTMIVTNEWSECIDPRFNWNPAGVIQWRPSFLIKQMAYVPQQLKTSTMGTSLLNNMAKFYLTDPAHRYNVLFDGTNMQQLGSLYVANRPLLGVGELGNICTRAWQTVRLYDHQFSWNDVENSPVHRVLDFFTVHPPSRPTRRGLVNPNTLNREVLAAVFYQAPEKEYLTPPAVGRMGDWNEALKVADDIIAAGPYTNLSDIGYAIADWGTYVNGLSEVEKESPIRNSCELMSVRHNLFTILMAAGISAQALGIAQAGSAGDWLGYNRGVAVVWRDPFPIPGAGGRHWWFVRHYKQLGD